MIVEEKEGEDDDNGQQSGINNVESNLGVQKQNKVLRDFNLPGMASESVLDDAISQQQTI